MISVLIDLILVLWVLAFGAMAIVPLILSGRHRSAQPEAETEDRVLSISIVPSPILDRLPRHRPAAERQGPEQRRAA